MITTESDSIEYRRRLAENQRKYREGGG
jgi:hypothetical protein